MTRAEAEAKLIRIVGPGFAVVSLNGTTADGTNGDLDDAIEAGFAAVGVTAGEWDSLTATLWPTFRDYALLAAIDLILLRSVMLPDETENGASLKWGDVFDTLRGLRSEIRLRYGLGVPTLTAGRIRRGRRIATELG